MTTSSETTHSDAPEGLSTSPKGESSSFQDWRNESYFYEVICNSQGTHVRVSSNEGVGQITLQDLDEEEEGNVTDESLDETGTQVIDLQKRRKSVVTVSLKEILPNKIKLILHINGEDKEVTLPFNPIPYTLKKVHNPLYVYYSFWSALGGLLAAGLDAPDGVLLAAIGAPIFLGSCIVNKVSRLQSSAKSADMLVIAVSGMRDTARITVTGALFYWAFASYFSGKTLAMNVGASDIILTLAADPSFWIATAAIGIVIGYLKCKVSQGGTSVPVKQLEKALRGIYLACSVSGMTIMMVDCLARLCSSMATSGYGLLLVDPIVASVVASVIVIAAIVGAYYGIRSQRQTSMLAKEVSMPTKFEKFDSYALKFRIAFMPLAVLASLLDPTLILVGLGLAISYLIYTHHQEGIKQTISKGRVSSTGIFSGRGELPEDQQSLLGSPLQPQDNLEHVIPQPAVSSSPQI